MSYITFAYSWLIVSTYRLGKTILFWFVPDALLEKALRALFTPWRIKVTDIISDPNAAIGAYDRKLFDCEVVVKNRDFYRRFFVNDLMALGECYMDGWYDCDSIVEFICCLRDKGAKFRHVKYWENQMDMARNLQTHLLSKQVAEMHYDLGNDLYQFMLDPTLNYSCGYFKDTTSLEQAQINKMDLIARKLQLKPGMKVLDLGCGFGSTAKYLAKNYGVSVVGYTISKEQIAYARKSCEGLDVEFRLEDYRNATGKYDRVYSIGFFEHIGSFNYRTYFEVVDRCLKDDGLTLVHSITTRDKKISKTDKWLNKYIFPGGEVPMPIDYFTYSDGLFVVEDVHNFGHYYHDTLLVWLENFKKHWPELKAKYEGMVGGRFYRMFEFYLLYCAGGFKSRVVNLYQVVYHKKGVPGGYVSVR